MTERVSNHVPEALMLKIAEAAVSWCKLREIEKQYGDNGGLGADMRSAELRMRAAVADLPEPPAALPWDSMSNRSEPHVEAVAKEIYDSWKCQHFGWEPWVAGGNSRVQDDARMQARRKLRRDGYKEPS